VDDHLKDDALSRRQKRENRKPSDDEGRGKAVRRSHEPNGQGVQGNGRSVSRNRQAVTSDSGRLPQGGDAKQAPCEASQSGAQRIAQTQSNNPPTSPDGLKPCPFCASKTGARVFPPTCRPETPYNPADRLFPIVRCMNCYTEVSGANEDYTGKTACARWNTRAASQ
jgi:hypothetical protein